MISFFKYQDPLRFTLIFLLLLLIRLPVFILDLPVIIPELIWDITGQKLAEGGIMYRDIKESLGPLSAGTYFLINLIFTDTHMAYMVLSLILVFLQATLLNFIINVNNMFPDRSFVPGLLYIIFSSLFFDFFTLSPILLGITFIILAFHFVFLLIRAGDRDEETFYTGALVGIATLFHFPLFVFLLLITFVFLLFTPGSFRKYFILLTGFFFPLLLTGTYYFLNNSLNDFLSGFFYPVYGNIEFFLPMKAFFAVLILPALVLFFSFILIMISSRYINYQYVVIRIFGFWIFFAIPTLYLLNRLSLYHFFIFVPPLTFFGTHLFLLIRHNIFRESFFFLFLLLTLLINYGVLYGFIFHKNPITINELVAKKPEGFNVSNSKIVVFGQDKNFYVGNQLATPYLSWELSSEELLNMDNYAAVSSVYERFKSDFPDVIADGKNIVPKLFERIPELEKRYEKKEQIGEYDIYFNKKSISE